MTARGRSGAFEGVLIDLYGTLVPAGPRSDRAEQLHAMARTVGIDPVVFERDWVAVFADRVLGRFGTLEETIAALAGRQGVRPSLGQVGRATATWLAYGRATLEACSPVLPGLDALRRAGLRLAVVSDCSEEPARLWSASPLGGRIPVTVFSCREGFCKPDLRMYRLALERLGLSAAACAFVGDGGSRELTGATAVGLSAYRYQFPGDRGRPDERHDPDLAWAGPSIDALDQLLTVRR